jgi:hypothetical protein
MLRPKGYAQVVGGFKDLEFDTTMCGHCNKIILVKPGTATTVYYIPQLVGPHKEEPGAACKQCMSSICLECYDKGVCVPFMKQIDLMEQRGRMFQTFGL